MPSVFENADSLKEIVSLARKQAPYYQKLYQDLPDEPTLAELPVIVQENYWQAHHQNRRQVLTGPLEDGIVVNTGGTTGIPKHSYFSDREWDAMVAMSVRAYEAAGVRDGDRVANLFASGNLYASFTLATDSLKSMLPRVVQFPIGFTPDIATAAGIIRTFGVNVLFGFPSHLLRIVEQLGHGGEGDTVIERVIYAGEMFTADQQAFLQERFPGIQICSAGYASVDAGLIGFSEAGFQPGDHRVFGGSVVVEILDEDTGVVIGEPQIPGRVVITSLTRRLMPLLRYPTGDMACWMEPSGSGLDRKFRLLGRAQESARVAGNSVGVKEVEKWLDPIRQQTRLSDYQLLVTREKRLDRLIFRLVGDAEENELAAGTRILLDTLAKLRPEIYEDVQAGLSHEPRVEWVSVADIIHHPRTGKMLRVVDRRGG